MTGKSPDGSAVSGDPLTETSGYRAPKPPKLSGQRLRPRGGKLQPLDTIPPSPLSSEKDANCEFPHQAACFVQSDIIALTLLFFSKGGHPICEEKSRFNRNS